MATSTLLTGVEEVRCDFCKRDVTFGLFLRCRQCADVDACASCFLQPPPHASPRLRGHRPHHAYVVPRSLCFRLHPSTSWTAREELRLLKAIGACGLGNWDSIALLVRSQDAAACEDHFYRFLAPGSRGRHATGHATGNAGVPLGGAVPLAGEADFGTRVGFMPRRGDFEVEADDEAEAPIANLELNEEDSPAQRALKLEMLRAYDERLRERYICKDFVLDYGAPEIKALSRGSKEELEISRAMKPFARFHRAEAHAALVRDLQLARRLRRRVVDLQKYHAKGFHNVRQVNVAEARVQKMKRQGRRR